MHQIQALSILGITPYANNNRVHTEEQIALIARSIAEFGFNQPLVVDEQHVVLVGHGRLLAAQKLGLREVPAIVITDLTETQKKAFRILDNKLQNDSTWNVDNLTTELQSLELGGVDLESWGLDNLQEFCEEANANDAENPYTQKVESPIYQPTGERPSESSLCDLTKYRILISNISNAGASIPPEVKEFLLHAAARHIVFDYQNIAEYYAHAPKAVQELMEESALVVIDFKKAIENGFVILSERLAEMSRDE